MTCTYQCQPRGTSKGVHDFIQRQTGWKGCWTHKIGLQGRNMSLTKETKHSEGNMTLCTCLICSHSLFGLAVLESIDNSILWTNCSVHHTVTVKFALLYTLSKHPYSPFVWIVVCLALVVRNVFLCTTWGNTFIRFV